MSFDLYEIEGVPVLASSEGQANYFAAKGVRAKVPGDPGIVEEYRKPGTCQRSGCTRPARESGWCHMDDETGAYRRNLRAA